MSLRSFLSRLRRTQAPIERPEEDPRDAADPGAASEPTGPEPLPGHYDDRPKSAEVVAELAELERHNSESSSRVIDPGSHVVVNITSYGPRLERTYLALESIARGSRLPGRLVLTLGEADAARPLPASLRRLVDRGLEIIVVPDRLRVHSKYWGIVSETSAHVRPLVVGDDDQLYPADWLSDLLATAAEHPDAIVAHRAHRIAITEGGNIAPYLQWSPFTERGPSYAAFGTGVSGMLLPPALLDELRNQGEAFLDAAPTADDIWIHSRAVAAGIPVVQTSDTPVNFDFVPGTQHVGLYLENVHDHANDAQVLSCYGEIELRRIAADNAVGRLG